MSDSDGDATPPAGALPDARAPPAAPILADAADAPTAAAAAGKAAMGGDDALEALRFDASNYSAQEKTQFNAVKPVTLHWTDLSVSVQVSRRERKEILHRVSGHARPGEMIAIMGSSGAGKTTLLQALSQRTEGGVSGQISINDKPLRGRLRRTGYVSQDDQMFAMLTVRETLQVAAELRLPASYTPAEREKRVDDVIQQLGLQGVVNSRIGDVMNRGISGGERRRVAIGEVLVADPSLLFLDEPTSGLDATTSLAVVETLRSLAEAGRTVVCTIHQPRSNVFNKFDKLMLLAEGNVVYFGPAADAVQYFAALAPVGFDCPAFSNPADFYLDLTTMTGREERAMAEKRVQYLIEAYRQSDEFRLDHEHVSKLSHKSADEPPPPRCGCGAFNASWPRQFAVLTQRAFRNYARRPLTSVVALIQNIFLAVIIGLIFLQLPLDQTAQQNRTGVIFFLLLFQVFNNLSIVLNTFPLEKPVILKERAAQSYQASAYFLGKMVAELPFQIINTIVFATVAYWLIGLNRGAEQFFIFIGIQLMVAFSASGFGLFVSALVPNAQAGQIIGPISVVLMMLFAGFFVNEETMPVWIGWLRYLSFIRYGFRAAVVNDLAGEAFTCANNVPCVQSPNPSASFCQGTSTLCISSGNAAIRLLNFDSVVVGYEIAILIAFVVGLRILAYLMLRFVARPAFKKRAAAAPAASAPTTAATAPRMLVHAEESGVGLSSQASLVPAPVATAASTASSGSDDRRARLQTLGSELRRMAAASGDGADANAATRSDAPAGSAAAVRDVAIKVDGQPGTAESLGHTLDRHLSSNARRRDELSVGRVQPVELQWKNVSYSIPLGSGPCGREKTLKPILRECSGLVQPGEVLAIMGATGAGKSSLLNVLAQRASGIITGEVLLNGVTVKSKIRQLGYVSQDDYLFPSLTVRETLEFAARLRLPKEMPDADKMLKVDQVIEELGLQKAANTRVGNALRRGLSGGERRRLSIGEVLIGNPSLLFLDEPTSGLDSATSLSVMETLRSLASAGRTIICTIHQPRSNIFAQFDKLMLVARGRIVYSGAAADAVKYFAALQPVSFQCPPRSNPADFFLDLTTAVSNADRDRAEKRIQYIIKSYEPDAVVASSQSMLAKFREQQEYARASWGTQFARLLQRAWRVKMRDPLSTIIRLVQTLFISILLGLLYLQLGYTQTNVLDRRGILFFLLMFQTFSGLGSVLEGFQTDKAVFMRERSSSMYNVSAFIFSKMLAELLYDIVFPIVFSCIVYWMVNLNNGVDRFFIFMGINVVMALVGTSLGYFISSISPNLTIAGIIAPVLLTIFALFGGFYNNSSTLPVYFVWLEYISFIKYGYSALAVNEFAGATFTCTGASVCRFQTGADVLSNLNFSDWDVWKSAVILLAMAVIWRLLTYVIMRFVVKNRFSLVRRADQISESELLTRMHLAAEAADLGDRTTWPTTAKTAVPSAAKSAPNDSAAV